jgi:hypothetical protein
MEERKKQRYALVEDDASRGRAEEEAADMVL